MASSINASTEDSADVLVVGGGPAGSATALLLSAAGHRVTLVDRAAFPRDKACSEYMSPEAVRILDRFGVVQALEGAGAVPLAGTAVTGARRGATPRALRARRTSPVPPDRALRLAPRPRRRAPRRGARRRR